MALDLVVAPRFASAVQASYACPCGCHPQVTYERGSTPAQDGCCCGNQFAVGAGAASTLTATPGFYSDVEAFEAPWGERLEAAWLVGPSVHGPASDHDHHAATDGDADDRAMAPDPVCGMRVDPDVARDEGLHSRFEDHDYYFCGKGCRLEFDEDPGQYLDSSYVPSM